MAQFIPLILIGGLMYLVLILPQQRRNRDHKALLRSLEVGDEVLMNSGIHGFVSAMDTDVLWVEVADNVELKVSRSAIAGKVHVEDDKLSDDSSDSKDTKSKDTPETEDS